MVANWSSPNNHGFVGDPGWQQAFAPDEELQYTTYMLYPLANRLGNVPAHL